MILVGDLLFLGSPQGVGGPSFPALFSLLESIKRKVNIPSHFFFLLWVKTWAAAKGISQDIQNKLLQVNLFLRVFFVGFSSLVRVVVT